MVYAAFEFPLLGARMAFRQAEKDHMVGPGEVIAAFRQQGAASRQVTVAQTEELYLIHSYQTPYCHELSIFEKSDSPSIHVIPEGRYGDSFLYGSFDQLGLVLFDQCPQAQRVSVAFNFLYGNSPVVITSEAHRVHDDIFVLTVFNLDTGSTYALDALSDYFFDRWNGWVDGNMNVTVQLYDEQDTLIRTERIGLHPMIEGKE